RDRMRGGRFKVFDDVSNDWWEEFRLYHRKGGRVVKENDDLLCATRYGIMMLRHARTPEAYRNFHRKIEMPDLGIPLMRKFVTWHNLKNEAGNGSWAIFDGMVTVSDTRRHQVSADRGNA